MLTPRERQVLRHVALGRLNKQIAYDLGISEVTVKLHRSGVMKKMAAATVGSSSGPGTCCPPSFAKRRPRPWYGYKQP